ncbi:prolyl oligopeptidase family serine peptidase [Pseudoalteromonas fenneropenaei]|uniref:Prolyl oligopeptidase family serine peptidase n=1 Tax=Pseudoalteromonas fenneropenaei TaxID=1737459 RepID=A0ABV7CPB1_9GAMM
MTLQKTPISVALLLGLCLASDAATAQTPLTFTDVFDFRTAKGTELSDNGQIMALSATPYRGDAEGQVYRVGAQSLIAKVERGTKAQINKSATWVAFTQVPSLLSSESASKDEKKKLKNNLVLVNTQDGALVQFDEVKDYQLSDDGKWLAYREDKEAKKDKSEAKSDAKNEEVSKALKADKKDSLLTLVLVDLTTNAQTRFDNVNSYGLSDKGLLWQQGSEDGASNQVLFHDFSTSQQSMLITEPGITVAQIAWHPTQALVAFTQGNYVNDDARRRNYHLTLWHADSNKLENIANQPGWFTAKTAKLSWSEQGERLYFGNAPQLAAKAPEYKYKDDQSLRDFDTIRAQKGLKVWHHQDPEIKPREIDQWQERNKNLQYQAVYHLNGTKVVQLTSPQLPSVELNKEARFLLAENDRPYLHEITYNGFYSDYYSLDSHTGKQQLIVKYSPFRPSLSPTGNYASYFADGEVWLKDLSKQKLKPLTKAIRQAIFADDQHDYPSPQPGYGFAGWMADGSAVLVYSKYDIWAFDVKSGKATRLTQGRETQTQYRVQQLDKDQVGFAKDETLFLSAHNLENKQTHVATLALNTGEVKTVLAGAAKFDVLKKAKHSDTLLFTKQHYHLFPDIQVTDSSFAKTAQITNLNPQTSQFAWGEKPELVQYKGYNGEDLQGVLIKPAGYQTGDKVPVVIYFYRYMTQRMYHFPAMELNHRPNFPMLTSNGYALFMPDIRFEIGHPGKSSTQTMINAAQKLIDIGVADPDNIALQGHSWSGYQSAFMITQTDMFKAVISGAPVSNMTSAYSGIRLGSGLARQFQYETGQSRIGKSLFEAPELYIENSPVFFADKVNTPILMMFGNKDDAVPYQEGIQYYLALRRAGKDVIFLEYEDEPHHLKKFPNQVDFSIRMLEYYNHHLKGMPAPQWMQTGEAYQEE